MGRRSGFLTVAGLLAATLLSAPSAYGQEDGVGRIDPGVYDESIYDEAVYTSPRDLCPCVGPTRGSIVIATGVENGEAWISIADTGCGIAPEALQRIFEPFYTTKPIGRGTGLGLAIAYSIVANHHGRIEVSSKPGVGSAFRVVLPVVQPTGDAAAS